MEVQVWSLGMRVWGLEVKDVPWGADAEGVGAKRVVVQCGGGVGLVDRPAAATQSLFRCVPCEVLYFLK